MDVLLINPPYVTMTSRVGVGHQAPLGLLMVGGALLDAGVSVGLLDAECRHLTVEEVVAEVRRLEPRVVMTGHAGSTAAHGVCMEMLGAIKGAPGEMGAERSGAVDEHAQRPFEPLGWERTHTCAAEHGTRADGTRDRRVVTVYGGPFPTYHCREILLGEGVAGLEGRTRGVVDVIVRGEGEATAVEVVRAVMEGRDLGEVKGIAFLEMGEGGREAHAGNGGGQDVRVTGEREPLAMDDFRVGWELLDENGSWDDYRCFGLGRAVIMQLSRGCPHGCTYCGQRGFWMKWRHRDPVGAADEIEWLVKKRGVRFITLADENPTTLKGVWQTFLAEVARRELPVKFFATIRATDIVRDKDILPLWKAAGIQYVLMGIDGTDAATLKAIKKGSTMRVDHEACRLLRENGIYSMVAKIVGLSEERWGDFWKVARQVALYDGDYLNVMYVTPHAWTEFAEESRGRAVADEELSHWTYRRPVLGQRHMKPWETFVAVKVLELWFHLRPRRVWRMLRESAFSRQQFWWCCRHMGGVWGAEILAFLRVMPRGRGRRLGEFWGSGMGERRQRERLVSLQVMRERATSLDEHAQRLFAPRALGREQNCAAEHGTRAPACGGGCDG